LFAIAVSLEDMVKIELAIREWARREPTVAGRMKRIDNRRMDYMRSLFGSLSADDDDVEVRCLLAFSIFIGNHFITADHGSRSRLDVISLAIERLLV
jgi:hypothetical protein